MGLNVTSLELMALARASGADFSRIVTIGRHKIHTSVDALERFFRQRGRDDLAAGIAAELGDGYCEPLLKSAFGAAVVDSIDASDYEQARIIHDMNTPMAPAELYSVVLDFGTLEHVFNVPVAFDNVARLCAPGAHILHMLPSNNLVGHGFYQFSPEFFFQIYAPERGYAGTRVFVSRGGNPDIWYEVRAPREVQARVDITSRDQLHILVLTQKIGDPVPLTERAVQQSDYVALWNKPPRRPSTQRRRGALESIVRDVLNGLRHRRKVARKSVANARADMTAHRVSVLTANFARHLSPIVAAVAAWPLIG